MSIADEILKLHELHLSGALTREEYEQAKATVRDRVGGGVERPIERPADGVPVQRDASARSLAPDVARCARVLRWLVIADAVVTTLEGLVAIVGGALAEQVAQARGINLPESSLESGTAFVVCGLAVLWLPFIIVSWIGLYRLRPWSRWLYLGTVCCWAAVGLLVAVLDFSFQWSFVDNFSSIGHMLTGAILTLVLLPPGASLFQGARTR